MIPEASREALMDAMNRFDRELRGTDNWSGWEQNEAHRYAIESGGRRYPVNAVISLAIGVPVSSFSGGDEANRYLSKKGFSIVQLRDAGFDVLRQQFEAILTGYAVARSEKFTQANPIWERFRNVQQYFKASEVIRKRPTINVALGVGKGNWAGVPWIAFLDSRETETTQRGAYCVFLFRYDMSGVYVTFNQGVTEPKKRLGSAEGLEHLRSNARQLRNFCHGLAQYDFKLDDQIDLRTGHGLGSDYKAGTVAYKLYETGKVPLGEEILKDLEAVLGTYDQYLDSRGKGSNASPTPVSEQAEALNALPEKREKTVAQAAKGVIAFIAARGFVFEPWQIAAYITALRTKPFVILAGVSGTGKSKLPALVAEATGGASQLIPVRPDWTDSSDVLGYSDLEGRFRPGPLLEFASRAVGQQDKHFVCIIDEMNLARVEHYFAEVLSRIEDRTASSSGGFQSGPLLTQKLGELDAEWNSVILPSNLAIVGTVNMDESAHGFSRKVLDRAFTIEFSDVNLPIWESTPAATSPASWPVSAWYPRAIQLSGSSKLMSDERHLIEKVINELSDANRILIEAQLQVGYRTRDEISLFLLHARELAASFATANGEAVDPLDLAFHMKILPRIAGGSGAIRRTVLQLLGWANTGGRLETDEQADAVVDSWRSIGRPGALAGARFPRTAARLCLMWDRLLNEGFTSFWL
jgi:hypothetical protein